MRLGLQQGLLQACLAKLLALRVEGFGDAIGEQKQLLPRLQLHAGSAVGHTFAHGHRHAARARQGLHAAIGAQQIRRVVASVDVMQHARIQVQHPVEQGDEHHLLVFCGQQIVELGYALRGLGNELRCGLEQGARNGHEQCCRHALARHIGDDKAQCVRADEKVVVKIAPHLARGDDVAMQLQAGILRRVARQDAQLHLGRNLQLLLQPGQAGLGDQGLAQLLHHATEALVLLNQAARERVHHLCKLAQLLFVAAHAAQLQGLLRRLGQGLELGAQQALLAAAHALAQCTGVGQLLGVVGKTGYGLGNAAHFIVATHGQAHFGVALCQSLQRINRLGQGLQAAAQVSVDSQQHQQHQQHHAAQGELVQKAVYARLRRVLAQQHQGARFVPGQVVHRQAAGLVGLCAQGEFTVLHATLRQLRCHLLPQAGIGAAQHLAMQIQQGHGGRRTACQEFQRLAHVAPQHQHHWRAWQGQAPGGQHQCLAPAHQTQAAEGIARTGPLQAVAVQQGQLRCHTPHQGRTAQALQGGNATLQAVVQALVEQAALGEQLRQNSAIAAAHGSQKCRIELQLVAGLIQGLVLLGQCPCPQRTVGLQGTFADAL